MSHSRWLPARRRPRTKPSKGKSRNTHMNIAHTSSLSLPLRMGGDDNGFGDARNRNTHRCMLECHTSAIYMLYSRVSNVLIGVDRRRIRGTSQERRQANELASGDSIARICFRRSHICFSILQIVDSDRMAFELCSGIDFAICSHLFHTSHAHTQQASCIASRSQLVLSMYSSYK